MTLLRASLRVPGVRSAFTGSDAVLDGLEVLEAALDDAGLDVSTSGTKTQISCLNLTEISDIHCKRS